MKALIVILLLTVSVQAQSLADAARKERERRAHLKPAEVIKAEGIPAVTGAQAERIQLEVEPARPQPLAIDAIKEWNEQIRRLLAKIQALQAEETATELQINDLNNQIFAPVIDQATKDQALARLGEARENLAALGLELSQTTQTLETIEIQGPLQE
jgi:cell division protein FtsB